MQPGHMETVSWEVSRWENPVVCPGSDVVLENQQNGTMDIEQMKR